MDNNHHLNDPWHDLAAQLNAQSQEGREQSFQLLKTFIHDLRETLGQIHSAIDLLLPNEEEDVPLEGVDELLSVVRVANKEAERLLAEFSTRFVEQIDRGGDEKT